MQREPSSAEKILLDVSPWELRATVMAGGLVGVGFGHDSDFLLIVTHDGRGVVDCATGLKIARDRAAVYPDEQTLEIEGVGPLTGLTIRVAGIFGGALCTRTPDGWQLEATLTNSSDDLLRLLPPEPGSAGPLLFTGFVPEVRAAGFSPTGRSFVIATGAEVFVFAR